MSRLLPYPWMSAALLVPAVRAAERLDERRSERGDRRRLELLSAMQRHIPSYWGPSPPSGGTQSMIW